jgi:hypothetical protein
VAHDATMAVGCLVAQMNSIVSLFPLGLIQSKFNSNLNLVQLEEFQFKLQT